jgi:LPXTG-motif cell wall-anchored protein
MEGASTTNGSQMSSGTGSVVTNSASPRAVAFTGSSTEILTGAGGLMLLGAILLARKVRES